MGGEPRPANRGARVVYVGHGTTRVDVDGVSLLTDPVLRRRVAHLRRTVDVDPGALRGIDTVLISHAHADHLDLPSLERLGRSMPIVVPRGLGPLLRRRRFTQVVELAAGESVKVEGVVVRAVRAAHDGSRSPFGVRAAALGYVFEGSVRVYFAGDTDLFPEMSSLAPLDVALLPIWGWGPSLGPGHLDPHRAAEAVALLRPRTVVPIHWGTYAPYHHHYLRARTSWLDEPADVFAAEVARVVPDVQVVLLRPGEETPVSPA